VDPEEVGILAQRAGFDATGYVHTADNGALRHAYKQHGTAATELPRGQLPVTSADMARLPVITRPENLVGSAQTNQGLQTLHYEMPEGDTLFAVEEVRRGRRELAFKTLYKYKTKAQESSLAGDAEKLLSDTLDVRNDQYRPAPTGNETASAQPVKAGGEVDSTGKLQLGLQRFAADTTDPRRLGLVAPGMDRAMQMVKKLAPSWFLPGAMKDTLRLGEQAARGLLSQGGAMQKDLAGALRIFSDPQVRAQQAMTTQAYLTGGAPLTALDPTVRGPAQRVRLFIDGLSDRAVREGVVDGRLATTFADNFGKYLRRSYRIHADPDYAPTRQQITRAIDAVAQHDGTPREAAATLVNDLLDKHQRTAQMDFLAGRGKLAGKDVSSLVARKDLLPEIRDLLGEIHDPVENVGQTIPRLARLIEHHHAQVAMREMGLKLGIFRDVGKAPLADQDVGQWVPLVSADSATHDAWAGLHTQPVIRDALTKVASSGRNDGLRALLWRLWSGASATAKTSKTILNPDSYAPNLIGGIVSGAFNANFRVDQLGRGLKLGAEEMGVLRGLQARGWLPANRLGLQEEIAKLTKLGLRGENLTAADLQQTLDRSVLGPLAKKAIAPLQHIYGGTDDLTKYIAWKSEMARYSRAFPAMPREQIEQHAADVVRATMPTYSQVPKALREASQLGLSPSFVNFTYETFRNTANSVRIGQQDLRAGLKTGNIGLIRAGAERLVAITAGLGLTSLWGWSKLSRADKGVSDEQDQAVRFFGPPWNRNGQLTYNSSVGADGKVQFSNQSYIFPQSLLWDAAGEAARMRDPDSMASGFLSALGKQFLGIDNALVLDALLTAVRGVDASGRRVINPESPTPSLDRIGYVADKAFKPVVADKIARMIKAWRGEVSQEGRAYSLREEGKRLMGIRAQTLDAPRAAEFKARGLAGRWHDATALYRSQLKLNRAPAALDAAYAQSEQARSKVFAELRDYYRFGRALNVPVDALVENLRNAGLSSATILGVLDDDYAPGERGVKETIGEMLARLRSLPIEKRKAALRREMLQDPSVLASLAARARDEAKGLTSREKLVRSLGVSDGSRAAYLRRKIDALPDMASKRVFLQEQIRLGVVTDRVAQQLAQHAQR
jgi:hypothetical protein